MFETVASLSWIVKPQRSQVHRPRRSTRKERHSGPGELQGGQWYSASPWRCHVHVECVCLWWGGAGGSVGSNVCINSWAHKARKPRWPAGHKSKLLVNLDLGVGGCWAQLSSKSLGETWQGRVWQRCGYEWVWVSLPGHTEMNPRSGLPQLLPVRPFWKSSANRDKERAPTRTNTPFSPPPPVDHQHQPEALPTSCLAPGRHLSL